MQKRYWLAFVALIASPSLGAHARAETRDLGAAGAGLLVAEACARHVAIVADPGLVGRIVVTADADHGEEVAQIAVDNAGNQARVGLRTGLRECWTQGANTRFDRTLSLRIRMPAGFPVQIREAELGDYTLDNTGPLAVSASGSMRLRAAAVAGDARIEASGATDIAIGRLDASRLVVELSGTGAVQVRDGHIGAVSVSDSGTAQVRIAPVVDSATLSSSGIGGISLGGVRGTLHQASSGLGRITVANRSVTAQTDSGD